MPTIRYEVDLYRVWVRGQEPPAYARMLGTIINWPNGKEITGAYGKRTLVDQRTVQGQHRTYTDGVLTATVDFTLAPGASVQLPALATLAGTEMTASLTEDANAADWCPTQWAKDDGYSLGYRFIGRGTA